MKNIKGKKEGLSCLPGSSNSSPKITGTKKGVVFQPMGRKVGENHEKTIMELALEAGLYIQSTCGGKGLCGKCRVRPAGPVSEPSVHELNLLNHGDEEDRLACQTRLLQGGMVWIPESSRSSKPIILTTAQPVELQADPMVKTYEIKITPPLPEDPQTLQDLLQKKLKGEQNPLSMSLSILQDLPKVFKEPQGHVTVVVREGNEILYISLGHGVESLGLAVDLGTTTIVVYLFDLKTGQPLAVEAEMNPQVRYGDDVISRIGFCLDSPQGKSVLSTQVRACVNELAKKACKTANVSSQRIMDCVMVGNTAMHHIFLGLDPVFLAQAPYMPVTKKDVNLKAKEVGLGFAREAWLHWLPVKAGFVGADTISVALAVRADKVIRPTLILDLGTNGEMILAVPGRMMCCSAAAGPAFEGGHITYGMRAGPGAIEQVVIDPVSHACKLMVIGEGKPMGLCGSGLVSLISQLAAAGFIMSGGSFNPQMLGPNLRSSPNGLEYVVAFADQCGLNHDLVLTSQDVSEIQLAKGAIRAGVEIMMKELGVAKLGEVLLAGAFGNYLDPQSAQQLGLFPLPEQNRILSIGNAAGTGAVMALISNKERKHADFLSLNMQYLELTTHPDFQELFVDWMAFSGHA